MMPPGVHDTKPGRPKLMVAKEAKVTPSTSFPGAIASNAARSSMWSPTGCWSRMPCTPGSAESASIVATSSPVVVAAGSATCREMMPAVRQRFCFIRTYVTDAGSSPTRTVARQGAVPVRSVRTAARSPVSSMIRRASAVPSMSRACVMIHSWADVLLRPGARHRLLRGRSPVVLHLSASHGPAPP